MNSWSRKQTHIDQDAFNERVHFLLVWHKHCIARAMNVVETESLSYTKVRRVDAQSKWQRRTWRALPFISFDDGPCFDPPNVLPHFLHPAEWEAIYGRCARHWANVSYRYFNRSDAARIGLRWALVATRLLKRPSVILRQALEKVSTRHFRPWLN